MFWKLLPLRIGESIYQFDNLFEKNGCQKTTSLGKSGPVILPEWFDCSKLMYIGCSKSPCDKVWNSTQKPHQSCCNLSPPFTGGGDSSWNTTVKTTLSPGDLGERGALLAKDVAGDSGHPNNKKAWKKRKQNGIIGARYDKEHCWPLVLAHWSFRWALLW